jgi:predicted nuclease with TOPRIM domain
MNPGVAASSGILSELPPTLYAIVAGLIIGTLVKVINKGLDRSKNKLDEHLSLRKELREELDAVKKELYALQDEVDEWKQKYYAQLQLTAELRIAVMKLTDELEEYKTSNSKEFPNIILDGIENFPEQETKE